VPEQLLRIVAVAAAAVRGSLPLHLLERSLERECRSVRAGGAPRAG
jgi:hypothetical protein